MVKSVVAAFSIVHDNNVHFHFSSFYQSSAVRFRPQQYEDRLTEHDRRGGLEAPLGVRGRDAQAQHGWCRDLADS